MLTNWRGALKEHITWGGGCLHMGVRFVQPKEEKTKTWEGSSCCCPQLRMNVCREESLTSQVHNERTEGSKYKM